MNEESHERTNHEDVNPSAITVHANSEEQRFELIDNGAVIGATHWIPHQSSEGTQRIFYHTTVDDNYGGLGLASTLVREALDQTHADSIPVVAVCPYVKKWLTKHPAHPIQRVTPRPEHLEALRATKPD